jgi:hypothetical protein
MNHEIDTGSQNVGGYGKQSPEALSVVNRVKAFEDRTAEFVRWYLGEGVPLDPRQLASARTHFEYAFYHLTRAVFQPADPIGDAVKAGPRPIPKGVEP